MGGARLGDDFNLKFLPPPLFPTIFPTFRASSLTSATHPLTSSHGYDNLLTLSLL